MPNGALPPDTLICGSFRLLKILPMERGKKPLILLMIPLIVDFAELIGEIMAFLIFDHAELAADLMLPHADESVDLIACTGEVTAVLMLFQIELAVDLMLLHTILPQLRENIRSVLEEDTDARIVEVDTTIKQKQAELLDAGRDQGKIDEIGDAIMGLREERQKILTEAAMRKDVKDRIDDLASFLDEQNEAVTEYSETLVRRLIEKITVFDEMLVIEFKSGLQIEVEV